MFISVALDNIQNGDRSALHIDKVYENDKIQQTYSIRKQKQCENQSKECHSAT